MRDEEVFWGSLANEVRGDASNLKGTDYHLLFALWLLLKRKSARVAFFSGNDLLAHPIRPPSKESSDSLSVCVNAEFEGEKHDTWIQLKCTRDAWTPSALLDGNLLENFVLNALLSQSRGREWSLWLVTTSEIRSKEIRDFVANRRSFRGLSKKLTAVVRATRSRLAEGAGILPIPPNRVLRDHSIKVLSLIAQCGVTHRDVLIAEIRAELSIRLSDEPTATHVFQQLYGAMLMDSSSAGGDARVYDVDWLTSASGHDFRRSGALDTSVARACDEQVEKQLPEAYRNDLSVNRMPLMRLLDDFLASSSRVFVLSIED